LRQLLVGGRDQALPAAPSAELASQSGTAPIGTEATNGEWKAAPTTGLANRSPAAAASSSSAPAESIGSRPWLVSNQPRNPSSQASPPSGDLGTTTNDIASKPITNPFFTGNYPAVPGRSLPPVTRQVTAETATAASHFGLPAGERPRMTKSPKFQLEYDVDAVDPAGIADVQLWGTSDKGQTWTLWQTDADRQSPLEVSVPQEGVFGFRIVVIGKNGLTGPTPQSGDLADLWVGVDTTRPTVRLTSALYGEGAQAGQLDIRWEANDPRLADQPITLQFSEQAAGPWTTIASGLPNTGQYFWPVESRIPEKIYLRIEAADQAGNIGEFQLTEPVSTVGLVPQAHIRGLRAALRDLPPIRRLPR
jgi:hypothetical protein